MIVQTNKLNEWTQEGFDLNEQAERRICEMVFRSPIKEVSTGNSPEWDVLLEDGTTIEVKFTDKKDIFIETHYKSGQPSGLNLSTADYYLIVHTGYWNGKIGKVKVIPTQTLRNIEPLCERKSYPSGGSGFLLKQELGNNDGWIGNLNYDETLNGFDLSGWQRGKKVNRR